MNMKTGQKAQKPSSGFLHLIESGETTSKHRDICFRGIHEKLSAPLPSPPLAIPAHHANIYLLVCRATETKDKRTVSGYFETAGDVEETKTLVL